MGLGDFFKEVGSGIETTASAATHFVTHALTPPWMDHHNTNDPDDPIGNAIVGKTVMPSIEHVSRAITWVGDNYVSQPISTALMAGELPGGPFKASNWGTAWKAADHISPGQALFMSSSDTQKAANAPLSYYKPDDAYLPPEFKTWSKDQQQSFLKAAGMPAVGNSYVEEMRQSSKMFKNSSGIADFALRWWADPVVLTGKGISAVRKTSLLARPAEGWTTADINKIMDKSTMVKAQEEIFQNLDNPAKLNNLPLAKNSSMGPRFGAIASQLTSRQDINDFLHISLGDVDALDRLTARNTMVDARLSQDTARFSRLGISATRYADNPNLSRLIADHMDRLNTQINADTHLVNSYNQVLDHFGELDKVNLNRWSIARAADQTDAQASYKARTARARGAIRPVTITPTPIVGKASRFAGPATPMDLGVVKSHLWGVGDFFSMPVTVARAFNNSRPNGYMRIDDIDAESLAELRGQISRIPGITNETRLKFLNDYLKTTTEGERTSLLTQVGATGAAKVAEKHGLDAKAGLELYQAHLDSLGGAVDRMRRYSAATRDVTLSDGSVVKGVRVDEFADDGAKLALHPNMVTKLANDHVFQDLDQMDRVLARHGSALRALRESKYGNSDWIKDGADYLTSMFKLATLARAGYIPRVLGDDLAGQWARAGAAAMAMRFGWGVRNGSTNLAMWAERPFNNAIGHSRLAGATYASERMAEIEKDMAPLRQQIANHRHNARLAVTQSGRRLASAQNKLAKLSPKARPATRAALNTLIAKHQADLAFATRTMSTGVGSHVIQLRDLEAHHAWLDAERAQAQQESDEAFAKVGNKTIQGSKPIKLPGGVKGPAAFSGEEGEYYQNLTGSDNAIGQIFSTNKKIIHGHLMRSFDHGGKVVDAVQDEAVHAVSWAHAINHQIMQDPLGRMAANGTTVDDLVKWLDNSGAGLAYKHRIGTKFITSEDLAQSVKAEVDQYMMTPEIRMKALEPGGVTPEFLKDHIPQAHRPEVHTGQVGQTQQRFKRALDDVQQRWFKVAATIPADRMSRHPLFNQLYEGHMNTLANQLQKQGAYDTTVEGLNKMATTGRRLALRDMRKLVFDISHRSDAAAALRFVMPFMSATNESFQRWGRIIADKPQIIGYANLFYNAPSSMAGTSLAGVHVNGLQDADGNQIDRNGYAYIMQYPPDPTTGKPDYSKGKAVRTLVPKAQRFIVGRVPKALANSPIGVAFGMNPASGNFQLSQNSADLVTQGDPWFSPGFGPIVQIPVNEVVKDKPKDAEVARHLGILPFGPVNQGVMGDNILGRSASFFAPSTIKNFLTAYDTSDERYQAVKLQIMQKAVFEHDQMGKPMPSPQKLAQMTKDYWLFSAASAFLQPLATQKPDAFQFYRDQYNALQRQNPMTADQEFIDRFGEGYFVFAQSQSHNNSGIQATTKAVALSQKYASLIAANPELGNLIVGPDGNGPFSSEAYSYQLNQPLTPGGAEMQRSKMNADDAMKENKRRQGWSDFNTVVNGLTAELHNRGLNSFTDKGAEDLKDTKASYVKLYSQPLYPDGTVNPFYNEEWSKDYTDQDPLKYDRLIPGLTKVADSELASQPNRTDLRSLQTYLGGRQQLQAELADRVAKGGNKTLGAKANADLKQRWQQFVDGLIESDTRFGELHTRYLSRDLDYNDDQEEEAA